MQACTARCSEIVPRQPEMQAATLLCDNTKCAGLITHLVRNLLQALQDFDISSNSCAASPTHAHIGLLGCSRAKQRSRKTWSCLSFFTAARKSTTEENKSCLKPTGPQSNICFKHLRVQPAHPTTRVVSPTRNPAATSMIVFLASPTVATLKALGFYVDAHTRQLPAAPARFSAVGLQMLWHGQGDSLPQCLQSAHHVEPSVRRPG